MACRLVDTKLLSEPMREYRWFGRQKQIKKISIEIHIFSSKNEFENVVCEIAASP